jgi:small subunit ribosomal protein S9
MADETVDTPAETAPATPEKTQPEETQPEAAQPQAAVATIDSTAAGLTLGQGASTDEAVFGRKIAPMVRGKVDRAGTAIGTGRRKTAVARVRIVDGDGQLTINDRTLEDFFKTERDRQSVLGPLKATDTAGTVNVWVRVSGGGTTGQAGAIVLGIARALEARDPSLHATLSSSGYLSRDSRMVERKKYGLKKARRSFQFSKR